MNKVNLISLGGDPRQYAIDDGAYELLCQYLARARARLHDDPDRDEVLRDVERSIGEKFANLLRGDERVLTRANVELALAQVGTVETDALEPPASGATTSPPRRRLYRLHVGQQIAGVCTGLAAYADIRVDWVRTIFLLLTALTGGLFALVYLALVFVLPIAQAPEEYAVAHGARIKAP
jgi:phage shock protein PspC (stress-responsive transcriptional regulator)